MRPTGRTQRKAAIIDLSSDSDDEGYHATKRKKSGTTSDDDFEPEPKKVIKKIKTSVSKRSKKADTKEEKSVKLECTAENSDDDERNSDKMATNQFEGNDNPANCKKQQASNGSRAPRKRKQSEKDQSPGVNGKKRVKRTVATKKARADVKDELDGKNTDNEAESTDKNAEDESADNKTKIEARSSLMMEWDEPEYLADLEGIERSIATAIIRLFDEENTIPFIARYRKEMTGNMPPEKLRLVKESYEHIKSVKRKADLIAKNIEKAGKMTPDVEHSIRCARDMEELEHIYAPFKPGTKRELAAKAKALGLEPAAVTVLNGTDFFVPDKCVDVNTKGLETVEEVKKGIQHIIAYIISKDPEILAFMREMCKTAPINVEAKKAPTRSKPSDKDTKPPLPKPEESKFSNYFKFNSRVKFLKSHQVLALNRGEKLKELSVKIVFPPWIESKLESLCVGKWFCKGVSYPFRHSVCNDSLKDAYSRLIQPLMTRYVRGELSKTAERESIEVFAQNLKNLLLTPPYKGHPVLAIDPGFQHGCKAALVSSTGVLLENRVLYLHSKSSKESNSYWLREVMMKHNCDVIAIGNGVGCRETEVFISNLIKDHHFDPIKVFYTIISEQGVSIYSCSDEAVKELPNLDPTVRSAISIARRLQDPLTELVKVEPRHLGVGMYQHDLPDKALVSTLQEIVIECVSFVGVDLNTAPRCVLKQIAGIGAARAERIIEWRENKGSFFNRDQLNEVKGIGKKSFEQCAGFVRILPDTVNPGDRWKLCPLDRTLIHPESYPFAMKFIEENDLQVNDIGSETFRQDVQRTVASLGGEEGIAQKYNVSKGIADIVIKGLLAPVNYDIRSEFDKPIFHQGVMSVSDLKVGMTVKGRVCNTTSFGAFVDIGVGVNGLIHVSAMKGKTVRLGDRVQVFVKQMEIARNRIGLALDSIL